MTLPGVDGSDEALCAPDAAIARAGSRARSYNATRRQKAAPAFPDRLSGKTGGGSQSVDEEIGCG